MITQHDELKRAVGDFWTANPCASATAVGKDLAEQYHGLERQRYLLQPYLKKFAKFASATGKDVLEIGVGMGTDHVQWARSSPRLLAGIDYSPSAIERTCSHLAMWDLESEVRLGDCEAMEFEDASFDIVYSWGVIHHSPDTPQAVREIYRVLRPGGTARVMIYHRRCVLAAMLWLRFGLLRARPWRSLRQIYANHVESPGTKAYTVAEAKSMFSQFRSVAIRTQLTPADLLQGVAGQGHGSLLLSTVKALWPRFVIRALFPRFGNAMLIEARK